MCMGEILLCYKYVYGRDIVVLQVCVWERYCCVISMCMGKILLYPSLVNAINPYSPSVHNYSHPFHMQKNTRYLPQNSQSLILLLEVCDVVIQIRSRCQGASVDVVLLACFSSISEELWVKDSNYLSLFLLYDQHVWGVKHRMTTTSIPTLKKGRGGRE